MSRTYRKQSYYIFRPVQTYNELKQQYFDDEGYKVSSRHRNVPTLYDDIHISAYKEQDHHTWLLATLKTATQRSSITTE